MVVDGMSTSAVGFCGVVPWERPGGRWRATETALLALAREGKGTRVGHGELNRGQGVNGGLTKTTVRSYLR